MTDYEKYQPYKEHYIREWKKMVEDARKQLAGTCPLIEDETILYINSLLFKMTEISGEVVSHQKEVVL